MSGVSEDNVIPFRRKDGIEPIRVTAAVGAHLTFKGQCHGIVHFFAVVPGRCQCNVEFWDGTHNIPPGIGVHPA